MLTTRYPQFGDLFREVDRFQNEFAQVFHKYGLGNKQQPAVLAPVNVWQDEHAVHVEADLPGLDPAKIDVTVREGTELTVSGERTAPATPNTVWQRQERPFGQFARVVGLPALVDADKVEAKYEAGVLRLTLPKSEAAKPRKIAVVAG